MIKITKETLYEIQNELIDDMSDEAWTSDNERSNKCLVYINAVRDVVTEIIDRCYDDDNSPMGACETNED